MKLRWRAKTGRSLQRPAGDERTPAQAADVLGELENQTHQLDYRCVGEQLLSANLPVLAVLAAQIAIESELRRATPSDPLQSGRSTIDGLQFWPMTLRLLERLQREDGRAHEILQLMEHLDRCYAISAGELEFSRDEAKASLAAAESILGARK